MKDELLFSKLSSKVWYNINRQLPKNFHNHEHLKSDPSLKELSSNIQNK